MDKKKLRKVIISELEEIQIGNKIITSIQRFTAEYLKNGACSVSAINNGQCEDIAWDVWEDLGKPNAVKIIDDGSFFTDNNPYYDDFLPNGQELLLKNDGEYAKVDNFKKFNPTYPQDKLIYVMKNITLNGHVWLYFNGKHYDAEAMTGVVNFLELPLYKRQVK